MDMPKTCGEALGLLEKKCETDELTKIAAATGVPVTTLTLWRNRPASGLRRQGRDHLRRIFEGAAPGTVKPATSLAARVAALEARLDALTRIAHEDPRRIRAMVKKSGGAA